MPVMYRTLLLAPVLVVALAAEDPANVPGISEDVPCVGDASFTIDLIIPDGYAEHPERTFPAFFRSSPGGNPNIEPYREWADREDFIVVALNHSRNGPWDNNRKAQDLALETLAQRGVRMHRCLNYAGGESGAGQASVKLVERMPDRFAGVHISIHSGNGIHAHDHQAVTIYAGLNDQTHSWDAVQRAITTYESQGNPLHVETHPGGHQGASPESYMRDVSWMYWRTLLSHPALTRADQLTSLARIEERTGEIAAIADPARRVEAYGVLLESPAVIASPAGEGLVAGWAESLDAAVDAAPSDLDRYWLLSEASQQPWYRGVDSGLRRAQGKRLEALLDDETIEAEHVAATAYRKVEAMEAKANTDSRRARVAAAWKQIAERFPDTRYGRKAAER